jgi:hypothetical protein
MMSAKEYPSLDPARYAEAKRMAEGPCTPGLSETHRRRSRHSLSSQDFLDGTGTDVYDEPTILKNSRLWDRLYICEVGDCIFYLKRIFEVNSDFRTSSEEILGYLKRICVLDYPFDGVLLVFSTSERTVIRFEIQISGNRLKITHERKFTN